MSMLLPPLGAVWEGEPTALDGLPNMEALATVVRGCDRCSLRATCKGVVFGEGVVTAKLMCIGEGPGAEEDQQGRPFVGKAGQLLDRILHAAGFDRNRDCYIANVVKCRPPLNRAPEPDERAACWPNLRAQIRLVQPAIVVLLGATALQALIDPKAGITRMRGQWVFREGIHFMPTYHPAALLRDPDKKRDVWEDFKQVVGKYREVVDPTHSSPYV